MAEGKSGKISDFWKGIKTEFKKIVWPTKDDIVKQTIAVISSSFYSREMELEIHIAKNLDMPVERVEYWINRKERKHDF